MSSPLQRTQHRFDPRRAAREEVQRRGTGAPVAGVRRSGESQDQRLPDAFTGAGAERGARGGREDCERRRSRIAGRRAGRGEGRDRHARAADHVRLETAGELRSSVRCHGGDPAGAGRRRDPGQDQLRRVRHGIVERKLRVRAGAESGGAGSRSRRIERRVGGGGGAGDGAGVARLGYRRLHPAAGLVLRRQRASRRRMGACRATG